MCRSFKSGDYALLMGFPGGSVVKNLCANTKDASSISEWEDTLEKEMATRPSILT